MAASVMIGLGVLRELNEEVRRAEAALSALMRLRSRVMSAREPIDEALRACGIAFPASGGPFCERWNAWAKTPALRELGAFLGGTDDEARAAAFERAQNEAQEALGAAKAKLARDSKPAFAVCVLCGAAAVVLMI